MNGKQTYSQANKALYDIRDNVESLSKRVYTLARTVRQIHEDIKIIYNMLEDNQHISRSSQERGHTFSSGNRSVKSCQFVQDSSSSDEERRIHFSEGQHRPRVVDLYQQRQKLHGGVTGQETSDSNGRVKDSIIETKDRSVNNATVSN